MDDIKLFAKSEKELEILMQTIRIYIQEIGMEFILKICHVKWFQYFYVTVTI